MRKRKPKGERGRNKEKKDAKGRQMKTTWKKEQEIYETRLTCPTCYKSITFQTVNRIIEDACEHCNTPVEIIPHRHIDDRMIRLWRRPHQKYCHFRTELNMTHV